MNKFSKILFTVLILIILVLVTLYIIGKSSTLKNNTSITQTKESLVNIYFGSNIQRTFRGEVVDGMSVEEVLNQAFDAGNITVKYKKDALGDNLDSVGSIKNVGQFKVLINGSLAANISQSFVRGGDKIELFLNNN